MKEFKDTFWCKDCKQWCCENDGKNIVNGKFICDGCVEFKGSEHVKQNIFTIYQNKCCKLVLWVLRCVQKLLIKRRLKWISKMIKKPF